MARIRDGVTDPPGGSFGRDAEKHLDGKLYEYAEYNALRRLGELATDDEASESIRAFADEALQYGITSVQTMVFVPMKRFEKAVRHTSVPVRLRLIRFGGTDATGRGGSFQLTRTYEAGLIGRKTMQQNLTAVLAQVNKDLLSRGQRATREALAWLGDNDAEVYSSTGIATTGAPAGPRLVNEAL